MTQLTIYPDNQPEQGVKITDFSEIASALSSINVLLEKWEAGQPLAKDASSEDVMKAYDHAIKQLNEKYNFKTIDVMGLNPDHPDKDAMRQKFLAEHTHADFEIRFFIEGSGIFYLHVDGKVYATLCEKGDLISVPANTTHWFDMGTDPYFKCIRFFTTDEGWVGNFTGSEIAKDFPDFNTLTA
jgi:1,2-dihydroxy-3-keto-5-methylthiopentene dioxygenase